MTPSARRRLIFKQHEISVVLDVGANRGQYATWLRELGFDARIISFEPQSDAFRYLTEAAAADQQWECRRLALGERDGTAEIRTAGDSVSTSMFEPDEFHLAKDPECAQVGTEAVTMARLDTVWDELVQEDDRVYLKIDIEGYELNALRGAEMALSHVAVVEAELSLVPNYVGAPLLPEVIAFLDQRGFKTLTLENNHASDHDGQTGMVDGIFVRRNKH